MSTKYPYGWKQCATCSYWAGQRDTNHFGEYAEVDSPMTKGRCLFRMGPWSDQMRQANASCPKFEKWVALK